MKKITSRYHFWLLVFAIGVCEGAGVIGSFFTFPAITGWYATLVKPTFSPPNYLFGPVWTFLYFLMGVALYLVWIRKGDLKWFWVQLILNSLWSIIFFGLRSPALALIEIFFLWFTIVLTIKSFMKVYKPAASLLFPYLLWVSFASVLNFSIWVLN